MTAVAMTHAFHNNILQPYPILYSVAQGMEINIMRAENGPDQGWKWGHFWPWFLSDTSKEGQNCPKMGMLQNT